MCRRNQLLGVLLLGLGLGLLLACWISSVFGCCCFGVGGVICGACMLYTNGKRC